MIWLQLKKWALECLVMALPCWCAGTPDGTLRYRFGVWLYRASFDADCDVYEAGLPLHVTPMDDAKEPF